jgi:predicted nuclease with TOPRIM domain
MADKDDLIVELLKEVKDKQKECSDDIRDVSLEQKALRGDHSGIKDNMTDIKVELAKLNIKSETNNQHLKEHMKRCNVLENLHDDNKQRIAKLEQPVSVKKAATVIIMAGAVISAIGAVIKFLGGF